MVFVQQHRCPPSRKYSLSVVLVVFAWFFVMQDATELVAKLRAYHNTSQLQEDKVSERNSPRLLSLTCFVK